MNMCSKCYRDHRLKDEQSITVRAVVEKSSSKSVLKQESESGELQPKSDEVVAMSAAKEAENTSKAANRCMSCNKKFEVLGFKCKCGSTFCGSHRYPEQHSCTFNFEAAGKAVIAKKTPLVVADKLQRI